MTTNETTERAAFEAWARPLWGASDFEPTIGAPHLYNSYELRRAWMAWQARAALPPPVAEPVDRRRCKPCAATRGGDKCWKCGTPTFEPHPSAGDDPALPPIDRIRALAKQVGYAIGVHGSQQRDFDVIAAPWADDAVGNHALLEHIAAGLTTDNGPAHIVSTERKPLGRYAATIQMDGWYKQLDISVCPNEQYAMLPTTASPAPSSAEDARYDELIFAVGRKHAGETRHDTALRYIRQAEQMSDGPVMQTTTGEGE